LVPAAAVIPTPRVCMRVVAVKRSVVVIRNEPQAVSNIEGLMGTIVYKGER